MMMCENRGGKAYFFEEKENVLGSIIGYAGMLQYQN